MPVIFYASFPHSYSHTYTQTLKILDLVSSEPSLYTVKRTLFVVTAASVVGFGLDTIATNIL